MPDGEPILTAEPGAKGGKPPFSAAFMTPLLLAILLNPINSSMLATALTSIGHAFPKDPAAVAWLIASLYLAGAISQPLLGRTADLFGPRRTLVFGTLVVALGGLLGALAPNISMLVVSRVLIGVGTSAAFPCAMAMIKHRTALTGVEPSPKIMAMISACGSATSTMGPSIGGMIVATLGWRWVFAVNLPVALIGMALALRWSPKDPPPQPVSLKILDLPGMGLFSGGMLALMLFFMTLKDGFNPWPLAIGVTLLAVLTAVEWHNASPFVDLRLAALNAGLRGLYIRNIVMWTVMYAYYFSVPQWMQSGLHLSAGQAGLLLVPYGVVAVAASFSITRFGRATLARTLGGCSMLAGCVMLTLISGATPIPLVLVLTMLFGAASGSISIVNQQSLLQHAPLGQTGAAAGMLRTSQYCGAMLATPITALVLHRNASDGALHVLGASLIPMAALVLVLLLIDNRKPLVVFGRTT